MSSTTIFHNLGLGDHIICNAIVRKIVSDLGEANLFCKKHNMASVYEMFSDIKLGILVVDNDAEAETIIKDSGASVIRIGCSNPSWPKAYDGRSFDRIFYEQAGMPFDERWSGFMLPSKKTRRVAINTPVKPYIFIHDDASRGFSINSDFITDGMEIIRPDLRSPSIIDWVDVIENASEIHCINSSFIHLVESIPTEAQLFYHRGIRNEGPLCNPVLRKEWITIG